MSDKLVVNHGADGRHGTHSAPSTSRTSNRRQRPKITARQLPTVVSNHNVRWGVKAKETGEGRMMAADVDLPFFLSSVPGFSVLKNRSSV